MHPMIACVCAVHVFVCTPMLTYIQIWPGLRDGSLPLYRVGEFMDSAWW